MNFSEEDYVVGRLGTTYRAIDVYEDGKYVGKGLEQERIIKLLENWECENEMCYCTFYREPDRHCKTALELIELIKGEQR